MCRAAVLAPAQCMGSLKRGGVEFLKGFLKVSPEFSPLPGSDGACYSLTFARSYCKVEIYKGNTKGVLC